MKTTPERLRPRTRVLKIYDGHGAYAWHLGDLYFLAAADLNAYLPSGATWADPAARVRTATRLIAALEADPRAMTPLGSFRFENRDEYRRHRRQLSKLLKLARRLAHWPTTVQAMLHAT